MPKLMPLCFKTKIDSVLKITYYVDIFYITCNKIQKNNRLQFLDRNGNVVDTGNW